MLVLVMITMSLAGNVFAQRATDIDGGKDYPLVSRFQGSVIQWYQHKNFDKYYLIELKNEKLVPKEISGEITRIQYSVDRNHTVTEIEESYVQALEKAGFNISLRLNEQNGPSNLNEELYFAEFNGLNQLPGGSVKPDHDGKWRYVEAMGRKDGNDIFIVVYITNHGWPLVTFDAVEVKAMESGLVTAQQIDQGLSSAGHIPLAGIYFDFGKATLKPESDAALKNIAAYVKAHPDRKFLIVGHTDNVGGFDFNMQLSTDRAQAVMMKLCADYGINGGQLKSVGVGYACPVSSNRTDNGKARNRRVELVEQ